VAVLDVLATALTTHDATRPWGLFLGGVDVIKEPATPSRYAVPTESITVTEMGRYGVSSMSFTIEDTGLAVSISDGMEVRFDKFAAAGGTPETTFLGWVSSYSVKPAFGEQGRLIEVDATGIEAILDWAMVPADVTFLSGSKIGPCIQSIVASAVGLGPLVAIGGTNGSSSTAQGLTQGATSTFSLVADVLVTAGTTVREAVRTICATSNITVIPGYGVVQSTVDFYWSLRVYEQPTIPGGVIYDGGTFTIVDAIGSTMAEGLSYDVTAASIRGVYIKGTNAAGSVLLTDGSGILGPIAYVTSDSSDSAPEALQIATDYLNRARTGVTGSFREEGLAFAGVLKPDGLLTLTDARVGLSAVPYWFGPITRTYPGGILINHELSFGGPPPSGAALLRQLTRDTRL
jgi:hypothetical protein